MIDSSKFIDISSEVSRTYVWPGGTEVTIDYPLQLLVSDNGHRIADLQGHGHYIPKGWVHLSWVTKPGTNVIIA